MTTLMQGDIFETWNDGNYDLMLVSGRSEFSGISATLSRADLSHIISLPNASLPVAEYPFQRVRGRFVQTIYDALPGSNGFGLNNAALIECLEQAYHFCEINQLRSMITNGVSDLGGADKLGRAQLILVIADQNLHVETTLISIDTTYTDLLR